MLLPDKQGGTTGGHVKLDRKQKSDKVDIKLYSVIPENNESDFKSKYLKNIQKCMKDTKFKPNIDDKTWTLIYLKKKLVGFLVFDMSTPNSPIITQICINSIYNKQKEFVQQSINSAINSMDTGKIKPHILVNNKGKQYLKLVSVYGNYGFKIVKNDGKTTTMEFANL